MKMKKAVFFLLVLLILLTVLPLSAMAENISPTLSVNPYGGEKDALGTVDWYKSGTLIYDLFLPADADLSALTVYIDGAETIRVGRQTVNNGETTDVFLEGGNFSVKIGCLIYSVRVMKSENLPAVYINTESGSLDYIHADKNNKEKATISISEDGFFQIENQELKQIKGRGNSTWNKDKKPYNIKFDKKISVLGMAKAKKWTLLSPYYDKTFARNPLTWYLAEAAGVEYNSDYRLIDLYINQEYLGTYILCESVEVGKDRVDIFDLEGETEKCNNEELDKYIVCSSEETIGGKPVLKWVEIPNDPIDITGGYLLECDFADKYDYEMCGFITSGKQTVIPKAPEYASKAQMEYISNYWQEAEDALLSGTGYNAEGKHYSDYFDMDSLVNMYLVQEFSGNIDSGVSSTFFCKDTGGKLVAACVWDFDQAYAMDTVKLGHLAEDPDIWMANRLSYGAVGDDTDGDEVPTVFNLAFRHSEFREAVKTRWAEIRDCFSSRKIEEFLDDFAETVRTSVKMNNKRWGLLYTEKKYQNEISIVKNYTAKRSDAFDKGFGEKGVQIFYDVNGGSGWMFDCMIYQKGNRAFVRGVSFDRAEVIAPSSQYYYFMGWNTQPDGSGRTYREGELLTLEEDTTLYAQWKRRSVITDNAVADAICTGFRKVGNIFTDNRLTNLSTYAATEAVNAIRTLFKNKSGLDLLS